MEYSNKLILINKFNLLLDNFNITNKLNRVSFKDVSYLPEGQEWLIELTNGENVYIHKCSYNVDNPEVNYVWVEYSKEDGIFIEINYKDKTVKKFIIISANEIKKEIKL